MKKIIMKKTIALTLLTVILIWGVQSTSHSFFGNIIDAVEDIIDEGEDVVEDIEDTVEDVVDEVEDIVEDVGDTAEDIVDEIDDAFDEVENIVEVIDDAFDTFGDIIEDVGTGVVQIVSDIADFSIKIGSTIRWNAGELKNIVTNSFDSDLIAVNLSDHINLWDPLTKEVIGTLNYGSTITTTAFSKDGLLLASGSVDKTVQLWDTKTQKLIARFKGHTDEIMTVAFNPDGVILASAGRDKTVRLWNTKTQKLIATLKGHTARVKSVAFSPDGSILASSSVDKTIRLWDTETQKLITTLKGHTRSVPHIIFSPDGSMLASAGADGTVRIWDHLTGQVLATFDNKFHLRSIAFSPDGLMLASGSEDGIARLWDLATEEILVTLKHKSPIKSVAFASGGNMLITGSADNIMRQWDILSQVAELFRSKSDINGDGTINVLDLMFVALKFGQTGQNDADINGDSTVDIFDLLLVAGALGDSAAAPAIQRQSLEMLTAADIHKWLSEAAQLDLTDPTSQRGILFLQQLLMALTTPKETVLLANYPNPFNPETWIPYQLAGPAEVSISIYAANGQLVRTLYLGHQEVGIYESRSHAAYWDGRNEVGESVASGVYFYTLSAGEFVTTRNSEC